MPGKARLPGWIVGLLAATAAFVALGFVSLGFYASGGGLLILAAVAICTGAAAAAFVDPSHRGRNTAIVAAYVVLSLTAYLIAVQSQPLPPGASRGGANVPAPR